MAVSNRFVRLKAQQLDECLDAFRILEEEGISQVHNMDSVSSATAALARHGVNAFSSAEHRDSLKASVQQALSRQEVKGWESSKWWSSSNAHASWESSKWWQWKADGDAAWAWGGARNWKADAAEGDSAWAWGSARNWKADAAEGSSGWAWHSSDNWKADADGGQSSSNQEGTQLGQKADMPKEEAQEDVPVAPANASGPSLADLYHTRAALVELAKKGDVRLVRGDYLVDVFKNTTKPVLRCQDVPEDAFVRPEELQDEATMIVAVSYCWCSPEHPDPDRYHLPVIAKMVSAIVAGRLASARPIGDDDDFRDCKGTWVRYKDLRDAGFAFGASAVAVLWDYMSLPQVQRSDTELEKFKRGLKSMNAWYGSRHVTKLILTDLPESAPRASYETSGWTCFEREVANLISPPWCMLTLARGNSAYEKLFEKDSYEEFDYIRISYDAFQAGKRSGPMTVEQFDVLLDTLKFTNGTDKAVVRPKYHECFSTLVDGATELSLRDYNLDNDTMEEALQVLLAHCHHVEKLDLAENLEWKPQLETFVQRVEPWASSLKTLDLSRTQVRGDVQLFGRLVHLQRLCLNWTKVSGDVVGLAPLVELEQLILSGTQVSGDVMGLAPLVRLETLNLQVTEVSGDVVGLAPLVELERLILGYTQVSGDVVGLAPLVELLMLDLRGTQVVGDCDALQQQLPKLRDFGSP